MKNIIRDWLKDWPLLVVLILAIGISCVFAGTCAPAEAAAICVDETAELDWKPAPIEFQNIESTIIYQDGTEVARAPYLYPTPEQLLDPEFILEDFDYGTAYVLTLPQMGWYAITLTFIDTCGNESDQSLGKEYVWNAPPPPPVHEEN